MASALVVFSLALSAISQSTVPDLPSQVSDSSLSVSFTLSRQGKSQAVQPGADLLSKELDHKDRQAVTLVLKAVAGRTFLSAVQRKSLDENTDGRVNDEDAQAILRHALGAEERRSIVLKEEIRTADVRALSAQLSRLMGMGVKLPSRLAQEVSLEAKTWETTELLDKVAQQLHGRWMRTFTFAAKEEGKVSTALSNGGFSSKPLKSKLPSVGMVSLQIKKIPFPQAALAIAHAAGCRAEISASTPGHYSKETLDLPVEEALADLALQSKLSISEEILFEAAAESPKAQQITERAGATAQTAEELSQLNEAEESSRATLVEMDLLNKFQNATGQDPFDPGTSLDRISPAQWQKMGLSPEKLLDFQARMNDLIQDRRKIEALSSALLTGHTEEISNIDPNFTFGSEDPEKPVTQEPSAEP